MNIGNLHSMCDKVYYIDCDNLKIEEYIIQGIQKHDSSYQKQPDYEYSLESISFQNFRNLENSYIRVFGNELYASLNEANIALNRLKADRVKRLKDEIKKYE